MPSDLYRFPDRVDSPVVDDGQRHARRHGAREGLRPVARQWRAGDTVEVVLPMPVRRVVANEKVEADRNRVALQRGPIVFAAEWPDNPGGRVRNLVIADDEPLRSEFRADLLGGVAVITGRAVAYATSDAGDRMTATQPFTAIPYFAWANRGPGEMAVWMARTGASVRPTPAPTLATRATVTASPSRRLPRFINDGEDPASSDDPTMYFDWWPTKGTTEWVEMTLAAKARVSEVEVYWFDDTGHGQVRVPARGDCSTRAATSGCRPRPPTRMASPRIATTVSASHPSRPSALRLEVTMQQDWSAGVQEWKVR